MKVWEEGQSVRVYPHLCAKTLDELNELFWLGDEFCYYTDRSEALRQAHAMLYEAELLDTWQDNGV